LPALLAQHILLIVIALILIGGGIILKSRWSQINTRKYILIGSFAISLLFIFILALLIGESSLSFLRPLFRSVFYLDHLGKEFSASYGITLTVISIMALFLIGVSALIWKRRRGWAAFWLMFSLALALRGGLLLTAKNLSLQPFLCLLLSIAGAGISIANYSRSKPFSERSAGFRRWVIFIILAGALITYLYRLSDIPRQFSDYEAGSGLAAIQIIEGDQNYERVIWGFWERSYADSRVAPFFVYFLAGLFRIGGITIFTLRAAGVFWAMASLIIIYYLTRLLFGFRRAVLATFLLAFSPWYLSIARLGNYSSLTVFYTAGAFLLFFLSLRKSRVFYPILGMVLGLNSYFYLPVKIILPIITITWIYQAIFTRRFFRSQVTGFLLFLVVYLVFSAGISDPIRQLSAHRGGAGFIGYETRAGEFRLEVLGDHLQQNLRNLLNHFFYQNEGRYFPAPRAPLFNRAVFLSALIGIGLALGNRKKPGGIFLLIWLVLALLPMLLNAPRVEQGVPRRGILLLPAVVILAAGALEYIFFFPAAARNKVSRVIGGIGAGIILSVIFISNLSLYFQTSSSASGYYPGEREFGEKIGELIREGYQMNIIMKKHPVFAPQVIDFITYPEVGKLYAYFYSADANLKRRNRGTNPFYRYRSYSDFDSIIKSSEENGPESSLVIANSPRNRTLLEQVKAYTPDRQIEKVRDDENRVILFLLHNNH